jgi:SAM-dependent methyltransferase
MMYGALQQRLPGPLKRWILHFETSIEQAVSDFAAGLPDRAWVLDAGAGEAKHSHHFARQRYVGVDLAVGDAAWNYGHLDCVADLVRLPFRDSTFDACLNVVTLEHLPEPADALAEIRRALKPGAPLLIIVPHEWEVHQAPHDFYRYTLHGIRHLLEKSGFMQLDIRPVGGYFRLLARRLLNGLQFFPGIWFVPAALLLGPPALVLPLLDGLDRERNFTLGYICTAKRR